MLYLLFVFYFYNGELEIKFIIQYLKEENVVKNIEVQKIRFVKK